MSNPNRVSIEAEVVSFPLSIVQQAITEAREKNSGMVSFLVVNGICVGTTTAAATPNFRVVEPTIEEQQAQFTDLIRNITPVTPDVELTEPPTESDLKITPDNITPDNIFKIIKENDQVTITDIGDILNLSPDSFNHRSTVRRIVKKLVSNGMVVGSNTYSVVTTEEPITMPTYVARRPYKMRPSAENIIKVMSEEPMSVKTICDKMRIGRSDISERMRVGNIIRISLIADMGLVKIVEGDKNGKLYALSN